MLTLQSDIDVWAEGVSAMFSDACLGTFTNAQDYWTKVEAAWTARRTARCVRR